MSYQTVDPDAATPSVEPGPSAYMGGWERVSTTANTVSSGCATHSAPLLIPAGWVVGVDMALVCQGLGCLQEGLLTLLASLMQAELRVDTHALNGSHQSSPQQLLLA